MSDKTGIEWADSTFNPWMGCTKVSPACDHCYAERDTARFGRVQWGAGQPRVRTSASNWKKPMQWNSKPFYECLNCGCRGEGVHGHDRDGAETWKCQACGSERITPARRRVFCASLADVFDNDVPPEWRADLFALIEATPNIDWMLLTKRIGNADRMIRQARLAIVGSSRLVVPEVLPNLWLGATICNQEEADRDIPKLLAVPAAVRFLSMEPLLGPVDLPGLFYYGTEKTGGVVPLRDRGHTQLDWVVVGGESGPNARPMHPEWPRSLRDQCAAADVPFLFKQWGEFAPREPYASELMESDELCGKWNGVSYRYGKKAAGRLLDGVQHDGYPKGAAA